MLFVLDKCNSLHGECEEVGGYVFGVFTSTLTDKLPSSDSIGLLLIGSRL